MTANVNAEQRQADFADYIAKTFDVDALAAWAHAGHLLELAHAWEMAHGHADAATANQVFNSYLDSLT